MLCSCKLTWNASFLQIYWLLSEKCILVKSLFSGLLVQVKHIFFMSACMVLSIFHLASIFSTNFFFKKLCKTHWNPKSYVSKSSRWLEYFSVVHTLLKRGKYHHPCSLSHKNIYWPQNYPRILPAWDKHYKISKLTACQAVT